mmetsp:Transcript_62385/g.158633  ORF Transcript_62385/g.158633 Transcript_62385/m.158633 type:complete len:248 (+) Transcript_62385:567-1310(+)
MITPYQGEFLVCCSDITLQTLLLMCQLPFDHLMLAVDPHGLHLCAAPGFLDAHPKLMHLFLQCSFSPVPLLPLSPQGFVVFRPLRGHSLQLGLLDLDLCAPAVHLALGRHEPLPLLLRLLALLPPLLIAAGLLAAELLDPRKQHGGPFLRGDRFDVEHRGLLPRGAPRGLRRTQRLGRGLELRLLGLGLLPALGPVHARRVLLHRLPQARNPIQGLLSQLLQLPAHGQGNFDLDLVHFLQLLRLHHR